MSDDSFNKKTERTRLCPSCRMSISVLATKCRFCGENVGRPKEETRSLSISDLGGETIVHYAPSSNVMEALEAFRAEETTVRTPEPKKRTTIFGRKSAESTAPPRPGSGLPELDERSKALASLAMPTRPILRPVSKPTWMKKIAYLGAFVAAIIILYFGSLQGLAIIRSLSAHDEGPEVINRAPSIMEDGGNPVDALQEAAKAVTAANTASNREILERSQKYFSDRVYELLHGSQIRLHDLVEASNLATRGWVVAPSKAMQSLRDEVDTENMAYGMHVVSINMKAKVKENKVIPTAVIQLYDKSSVPVEAGSLVWNGRFQVQSVTEDFVQLKDLHRKLSNGTYRTVRVNNLGIPK